MGFTVYHCRHSGGGPLLFYAVPGAGFRPSMEVTLGAMLSEG